LVLAWGFAPIGTLVSAESEAVNAEDGMEAYALIAERNIFDPTRRKLVPRERVSRPDPPPRAEVITLSGSLLYSGKAFGFFSGSGSDRSVVPVGERVADLKLLELTTSDALLAQGETTVRLRVGGHLERRGDSPWELTDSPTEAPVETPTPDEAATAETASPAESGEDASASDLLRQMMERRRQEMNR
jgi:hypothetical protein